MVNINGIIIQHKNAAIALDNRGLNYGDAVFETLRLFAGRIFFWEDHYERLITSMKILKMEIPKVFSAAFLESEILKTIDSFKTTTTSFRVKLLVWRKQGGKYTPKTNEIEYAIIAEILDSKKYTLYNSIYEVGVFEEHYISSDTLSTLKTTNKIINVLGSIFAEENGYQNCFLLNKNQCVVEALNGNIFVVSGNKITTSSLAEGCLNGIMRKQLISILKGFSDYKFEETSISMSELQTADEIFITNVIQGIVPITKFQKKEYTSELAKCLLPKLNRKLRFN